jgi:putative transposase
MQYLVATPGVAGITISMEGRERAFDNIFVERLWGNVKPKDIYLKRYASMGELITELAEYFIFYNGERSHQSLGQKTLNVAYQIGTGGVVTS